MEQQVFFWEQNNNLFSKPYKMKMKIAICDSDKAFLSRLKKSLYIYAENHRLDMVVDCFLNGEDIVNNKIYYNIIFLGDILNGLDSFDTAHSLRLNHIDSTIVFISNYTDSVFDAFKVDAYRFLKKPIDSKEVFAVLDDYFKSFSGDYPMWIKCGEDIVCINTDDIYYLEADNKYCKVHLEYEVLHCNRTMAKVYSLLPKNRFLKTNRSFIVNVRHIKKYNNKIIVLKNGESLHPSRNFYRNFREDCRRFLNPIEP